MRTPRAGRRFQWARSVLFFVLAMACAGRLAAQTPGFQVLQSFSGPPNGDRPETEVTLGSDGNYYGTTEGGGNADEGTVFKITPAGVLTTLYSFTGGADGAGPAGRLIQASDGNFYGTTAGGGDTGGGGPNVRPVKGPRPRLGYGGGGNGYGTVFKITPAGVLTTLYTFTGGAGGSLPGAGVAQGSDGNFYGTTEESATGFGTVYQLTPAGVLTTLHTFQGGADGGYPICDLILGGDGKFYGTTSGFGGSSSDGTVFKITTAGVLTTLYNFSGGADGAFPEAGLILGSDGNFYGTTEGGGNTNGDGTVFQITPAGSLATLCAFPGGTGGSSPTAALIQGSNGNFYGTTPFGGSNEDGAVFEVALEVSPAGLPAAQHAASRTAIRPAGAPSSWVLTTLYSFSGPDGQGPAAGLILGGNGNFFGVTPGGGGTNAQGTIFQITPAGALTTLYSFDSTSAGAFPVAGLTQGSDGNFYGTTPQGGNVFGNGSVFKITPAGVLTGLYALSGGAGGSNPEAGLTLGSDGNFYGTTYSGGNGNGDGTIFKITPAGAFTTLYTFTGGADGANPNSSLLQGTDGNFHGTTHSGSFFEITPAGSFTYFDVFTGGSAGAYPNGLTLGSGGNFYGTTEASNPGQGTVFELTPAGDLTTLATLTGADGEHPGAGLTLGSDGKFYGTAQDGGNSGSYGTVFQATPAGALTALYAFTGGDDGADPVGGLTQASDGNFYGTTSTGGANGYGTVFRITSAGALTTLYTFSGPDGANPQSALTLGSDGNLYGTAENGGQNDLGVVYRLILAAPAVTSGTASAQVDAAFSYQIVATNNPTSFGASNLPAGLSVDATTGLISGTPTQSGAFTVGLTATNSVGTGSGTLSLTVSPGSVQPPVVSGGTPDAQVGSPFTFQISATNNPTSFGASNLPPWLSVDDATGIISGTPTQIGTFLIGLSATNSGGTGVANLALTVYPATPVISSALTASGRAGVAFTYQITASNTPTSFGAAGLPAGLSVDPTMGVISGTPTVSGTFSVNLSATNAGGTGTAVLTITLAPALPVVTLVPTVPQVVVGSGNAGKFTLSISAPQSVDLIIPYTIKGTAINGVDYDLIKTHKKIKAGKTSKIINIIPQGDLEGASKKVVTLVLTPGSGYTIGTTGKVKVKILSAP